MAIKSIQNPPSPLFHGIDQSAEGEVVVTCDKILKDKTEARLSHFGIYLKVVFEPVVWDVFTDAYKVSMKEFQYCPLKKCTIERTVATDASVTSTIAINNSIINIDQCFAT